MYIVGLDPSTSCVGVALIEKDDTTAAVKPLILHGITFSSKIKTLYEKYDFVKHVLKEMLDGVGSPQISGVYIEDVVLGFQKDRSTAGTIVTLAKFNSMVSLAAREVFVRDPIHIISQTARKDCGLKLQRPSICGMTQKEQVFSIMASTDLSGWSWPSTKTGKVVPWSRDATDAFVIAKSGASGHHGS